MAKLVIHVQELGSAIFIKKRIFTVPRRYSSWCCVISGHHCDGTLFSWTQGCRTQLYIISAILAVFIASTTSSLFIYLYNDFHPEPSLPTWHLDWFVKGHRHNSKESRSTAGLHLPAQALVPFEHKDLTPLPSYLEMMNGHTGHCSNMNTSWISHVVEHLCHSDRRSVAPQSHLAPQATDLRFSVSLEVLPNARYWVFCLWS